MAGRRDPIDRLVDLAIAVPVSTAVAARRSMPIVGRLLRRGVAPGAEIVDALVSGDEAGDRPPPAGAAGAAPEAVEESLAATDDADRPASRGGEASSLPIDGYDHLAARQVVDLLDSLTRAELAAVDAYERAHRHRQTVLRKIEQLAT